MTLIIRAPKPTDQANLENIFFLARKVTFIPQAGEKFQLKDYTNAISDEEVWVAEQDGVVVGFTSMLLEDNFVHNLFVHPSWHRTGIGSALLKKAESRLGYPMELRVRLENWKARRFYQKNGWNEVFVSRNPYDQYYCYRKYVA